MTSRSTRSASRSSPGATKDWKALIDLCKTLNQTPPDQLEEALKPILDVDGVLWFLAVDNALINSDGYWTRASDYSIYRDPKGKFHVIPHDMNETFHPAMMFGPVGPTGRGRPGGRAGPAAARGPPTADLDPLVGLDNSRTPLRSRLLAVPALQARLPRPRPDDRRRLARLGKLGPVVDGYRALIEKELEEDTRKLSSFASFRAAVAESPETDRGAPRPAGHGAAGVRGPESPVPVELRRQDGRRTVSARSAFARFRQGRMPAPFKALVREQGFDPHRAVDVPLGAVACDLDAGSWERFDA